MKRLIVLLTVVMAATMSAPAKSRTTSKSSSSRTQGNTAVVAYTLASCSDCAAFKQFLRQSGVKTTTVSGRDYNVSLYPTVVYSDGTSDNGQRLYARQVKLPRTLRVIETN